MKKDEFFAKHWKPRTGKYFWTGWDIVRRVEGKRVIDIGCGNNQFKGYIPDLVGLDPYTEESDIKIPIEHFTSQKKWEVALCFGSINFDGRKLVESQIQRVSDILTDDGEIYWRQNPGRYDHRTMVERGWEYEFEMFEWSHQMNFELAKKFGFEVLQVEPDGDRLYAHWRKIKK